jgi:hypothetical protein
MANSAYSLSPIYGNCQVLSPDNILMFRCDDKRAKWYLNKKLAEIINECPLKIRLKFQPKGLGNHGKKFGLIKMENQCVNCGKTNELNRHHVVPYCYRKFFPLYLKSHNFHDVLALCISCHENYERSANKLKEDLSIIYNAPINGEINEDKELIKYIKISITLLNNKIPKSKSANLKKILKDRFNIKKLTTNKLKEISSIKVNIVNRTHGEIVMSKTSNIQKFTEMWRKHFIDNNDCTFLPKNWSIQNK